MATKTQQSPVVKQIDKQFLVCGICLDRYKVPKVLPCLHTFCQKCLQNYVPPESLSLSCPICRQQSILPIEGVAGLQNNFFITNLMEVLERPENNNEAEGGGHSQALQCSTHEGTSLEYYCDSCETVVCRECTVTEHNDHHTILLQDVIEEHKAQLRRILEEAKSQIPSLKDAINQVATVSDKLSENRTSAEGEITEKFRTLDQYVKERRDNLIKNVETIHDAKQDILQKQKATLEQELSSILSNCEFTEQALSSDNETQVLLVKKQMTMRLQELAQMSVNLHPEENDFIQFSCELDNIEKSISNLGGVHSNSAIPHETVATGEGLKRAVIGEQTVITVTTKNYQGDLVNKGKAVLKADMQKPDGTKDAVQVLDNRNGTYDVVYKMGLEGIHYLIVKLFNVHIKGSPYRIKSVKDAGGVMAKSPGSKIPRSNVKQRATRRPHSAAGSLRTYRKANPIEDDLILIIGSRGRNRGEFTNPQGVACTTNGRIIVADSNNQCMQVFTNHGDCKLKFGVRGRSNGQLQRPTGVAVANNGNYVIADYDNKWINIFASDGKYINKIGTGKLIGPKGVAVDQNNNIIVADNKASMIYVFTANGKLLNKFGSRGTDDEQLCGPHFVAVTNKNQIVVTDFHNHCVKVFDQDGALTAMFGSRGEGNGQFNAPTGVAVDVLGNIIVSDWGNSRVQVRCYVSCDNYSVHFAIRIKNH